MDRRDREDPSPEDPTLVDGGASQPPLATSVPSLPGFRIARKLGEGGMGVVYEAEQLHPHRSVALKVIRAGLHADPITVRMFEREMQTLARLRHPGIAAIFETGTTPEGLPFYTMELVRGETLDRHLRRRKAAHAGPDLPYRLALFRKICEAVAYAHQRGIIHRDLKPANVLVLKEPSSPVSFGPAVPDIKVLDFGLARIADPEVSGTLVTEIGRVKGTLAYISPEQVQGNPDEIDLRTDVYSLGVMLYEIVTGDLPYDLSRTTLPEAVRVICQDSPRSMASSGGTRLDPDIVTIVGKALAKEPSQRYSNAQALAEDVQRYLTNQPIQARPPSAVYQFRKLVARHKLPFAFAGVLLLVLSASTVGLAIQASRIAAERDRASQQAAAADRVAEFLVSLFRVSDPGESRGNTVTAREILDKGSDRIERELQDQPLVRARLLDTMGNVYRSLGLFSRAEPMLAESLRIREAALGTSHPDVAISHNSLAHTYLMQGRPADALRHAEKALEILGGNGQAEGVPAAWASYFVANAHAALGEHARAEPEYVAARGLFERHLGHVSLPVAWCLQDLGRSRALSGDLRGALPLQEEALQIQQEVLGSRHPDIAMGLNNAGYMHLRLGHPAEARSLLERAVAMSEQTNGPEHPATANILESLGELEWRTGDLDGARSTLERAAAILEKRVEPSAYERVLTNVTLARVLLAEGKVDRAGTLLEASLALHERTGCLSAEAVTLYQGYADYLRRRGRAAEAAIFEARARVPAKPTGS